MTKILLALSAVLFSSQVFATAALRLPVNLYLNGVVSAAAEVNKDLAAAGEPTLPLHVTVSTNDNVHQKMTDIKAELQDILDRSQTKWNRADLFPGSSPAHGDSANARTCYSGEASEVVTIVKGLIDVVYSDQLQIYGYKYKNSRVYDSDEYTEELEIHLQEYSPLWKNWTGKGEDLLILTAEGDDGYDVHEGLIPKCR